MASSLLNTSLTQALIQAEIALLPTEIALVSYAVSAMVHRFAASSKVNEALTENVTKIVEGINSMHPDWPGSQKREYARNAIAQYVTNCGNKPDFIDIDNRIQLEVTRLWDWHD